MPIRHSVIHKIDKKPDGSPAALHLGGAEQVKSQARDDLISYLKGKQGRKFSDYFRDFIGCQDGVDGPGESRALLKAFSDFVESEDLGEDLARVKTSTLISYAMAQAKLGEPITLDELSEALDDNQPKAFADFIRDKDYRLSISFESHLLKRAAA